MNIERINKIAMIIFTSSVISIVLGIVVGICGSSFGLILLTITGIVGMMVYEWMATYIEDWYDNCDNDEEIF